MKWFRSILICLFMTIPAMHCAGNAFFLNFTINPDPNDGTLGSIATKNCGVSVVRDLIPNQIAYEVAGQDGPGIGRIYSKIGQASYVLTDIGNQYSTFVGPNQKVMSIVECYAGQFGWDGPAYVAANRQTVTFANAIGNRMLENSLILTKVPLPSLIQAAPTHINVQIPTYIDNGGQAVALQLWRQGSDGIWSATAQLPLSPTAQNYVDTSVTAGASYWYGVSVIFSWPGGSGEGALPELVGQYVSQARAVSGLMVAAEIQPTPTPVPTLAPQVNHDLGQAGWAAGPNPSRDGLFRVQFHTDKAATWQLKAFTLDGGLAHVYRGTVGQNGWQLVPVDLSKAASGVFLMELRVTQEGEAEKTLPIRKVAIIR